MIRLLVRTEASPTTGLGHLMRCTALAEAARDAGMRVRLLTSQSTPGALIDRDAFEVRRIRARPGTPSDAKRTREELRRWRPQAIVVDGYAFDAQYQRALRDPQWRLLWIDDEAHAPPYSADLILNQNPHARAVLYQRRGPKTRLLLGLRFALLRRRVRQAGDQGKAVRTRILISMGAADRAKLTRPVLQQVRASSDLPIDVVHGVLSRPGPARSDAFVSRHESSTDLVPLMRRARVAVVAAGSICWELCHLGIPIIAIPTAPNQEPIARAIARRGAGIRIPPDQVPTRLASSIRHLLGDAKRLQRMGRAGRSLIDGRGADRVLHAVQESTN